MSPRRAARRPTRTRRVAESDQLGLDASRTARGRPRHRLAAGRKTVVVGHGRMVGGLAILRQMPDDPTRDALADGLDSLGARVRTLPVRSRARGHGRLLRGLRVRHGRLREHDRRRRQSRTPRATPRASSSPPHRLDVNRAVRDPAGHPQGVVRRRRGESPRAHGPRDRRRHGVRPAGRTFRSWWTHAVIESDRGSCSVAAAGRGR